MLYKKKMSKNAKKALIKKLVADIDNWCWLVSICEQATRASNSLRYTNPHRANIVSKS